MERNYSDIQASIRHAQEQRSKDLGELIAARWKQFKVLFSRLQYRQTLPGSAVTNPSALIAYQPLP